MKDNQPITKNEVVLDDAAHLVSSTDIKGQITHCNQAFIDISGFSKEELMGNAHNIVRHPDMPGAAFAGMWKKLKNGQHWQGLVKNRCKSGDYYWVDAYVTPVLDKGQIIGYESVRIKPNRDQVERADKAYQKIQKGQSPLPQLAFLPWLIFSLPWLAALCGLLLAHEGWAISLAIVLPAIMWATFNQKKNDQLLATIADSVISDALAAYIYSGENSSQGKLHFAQYALKRRLQTVLVRIKDNMGTLNKLAESARQMSDDNLEQVRRQNEETDQLAQASHQITQAA